MFAGDVERGLTGFGLRVDERVLFEQHVRDSLFNRNINRFDLSMDVLISISE